MAQSARDQNQVASGSGSYLGDPTLLKAENVTGYLKAVIYAQTLDTPTVSATNAGHDENSVASETGSYTTLIRTLKATTADGYLRAVIM